mmetsp:Transcript_23009/g.23263  ORF Transcript_23009/g.23263 Transcript_23009/m.23263 type:complete len:112 (+) Transcript_23009:375-710(+)
MNRNNNRQEPHTTTSMTQAEETKILDAQVEVMIMVDTTIMEMTTGSLGRRSKYLMGGAITACTDRQSDHNTFVLFGTMVFDSIRRSSTRHGLEYRFMMIVYFLGRRCLPGP